MNAPLPFWPAALRRDQAMAYLSLTSAKFEAAMSKGQIPYPIVVGGQERWSRAQMDEYHRDLAKLLERLPRSQMYDGVVQLAPQKILGDYNRASIRRWLQAWAKARGHKVVPHGLRKNAVIALIEAGCSRENCT